jgi:hypothetical protein
MRKAECERQNKTGRRQQAERTVQQNSSGRSETARQDCRDKTVMTRLLEEGSQDRTTRSQDRAARTGQLGQDRQNRTSRTDS